ncbi:MAG: BrxA family protein [Bacillota bacterium]
MVETFPVKYTSRILKASALLDDTKTLLGYWDGSLSVRKNLQRAKEVNIFGKASRKRVEDILTIFRQRYCYDDAVVRALAVLVKGGFPSQALNQVLYFFSVQADRLLYDTVTKIFLPHAQNGQNDVYLEEILKVIKQWVKEGKTTTLWSESTVLQVARNLLTTLRDFGILQGSTKKKIAPLYLMVQSFAFIAFYLHSQQNYGDRLLIHPAWQLFFLSTRSVERLFFEAHQEKLLAYYAAGSVIRIEFPAKNLEEYARALTQRKNQSA